MPSFNKVILAGHLTRDPALKFLPNQTPVAEFGLAMNRRWKTQGGEEREEVCFVDCAAFGKPAETISQYCQKGKALLVEGRMKFDQWEDKNGGGKRSRLSVVVEHFTFLGGRDSEGDETEQRPAQSHRAPSQRPQTPRDESPPFGDERKFKEADIPFGWSGRDSQSV